MKKIESSSKTRLLGIVTIFFVFVIDKLSKSFMLEFMLNNNGFLQVTPFFNLVATWNRGVSFSMFSEHDARYFITAVTSIITLVIIIWMWKEHKSRFMTIALSCVAGGSLGNISDRITHGAVFDFLDFHIMGYHWPAFNMADSFIVLGAFMILYHSLWGNAETSCRSKSSNLEG